MKTVKPGPRILIFAAVPEELSPIAESGVIRKIPARLITTGPGLVNTACALTRALEKEKPALMIQTGCAGAFAGSGLGVGDIGVATRETDVHLGIESQRGGFPHDDLPFPVFTRNSKSYKASYPLDKELAGQAERSISRGLEKGVTVGKGPFVTVATITATDERAKELYKAFRPCMESMEGSAAAHLALLHNVPLLEIRAASNLVGNRMRDEWNLPLAFERAALAVELFISSLKNQSYYGELLP